MKIRTKRSGQFSLTSYPEPEPKPNSSGEIVVSNEDLLTKILVYLPIRSVIYYKSVSKQWLSIITNPRFSLLRNTLPLPASALFLHATGFSVKHEYEFVPLDDRNYNSPNAAPFKALTFVNDPLGIRIIQSCNGLLLCSSCRGHESNHKYYVYNPTTKQFTTLPQLSGATSSGGVCGVSLAFDPSKSHHYKVVCVRHTETARDHFQIEIYSSETGPWRVSGQPFTAHSNTNFRGGVYWNGSIHWINDQGDPDFLYFNVVDERLETMPRLPNVSFWIDKREIYFGESNNHMHLLDIYPWSAVFRVHEMKRDYSEWFVKYTVDLDPLSNVFPEMISQEYSTGEKDYGFNILSVVRREEEDEDKDSSFLVLKIPGKAIRYNLVDKCFEELREFSDCVLSFGGYGNRKAFEYIESLACV